jgi:thioredoxin 1
VSGAVADLTADTFDQTIAQDAPVLVDFWSEFCSPCVAVGQAVTELAEEFAGRVVVTKVDVVAQPELAARFNVGSVPTLLVFKGGNPVGRLAGARPKTHIVRLIEPHLD